ncbi:hypothetical protein JSY14_01285 [Brachybacterium sp. EF45031]|uniref:sensor histidine kinase n=1 Tax=Brachybacterium sillae TaxID=2810536 RepID=UPI00217D167C|nr:ATP-binding protein [Brachybacterium sillae]MCS6710719.1 hypothetical protein [Brachybacterium sillae]
MVHGLLYALVALTAVRTLLAGPPLRAGSVIGLLAVAVSVYSVGARRTARRQGPDGTWSALPHLAVTVALWAGTFLLGPDAVWVAFGLDFAVLQALPLPGGVVALAMVTVIAIVGYAGGTPQAGVAEVLGPVIGALVALAVVQAVRALQREVAERTRLARELLAAQARIRAQEREAAAAQERERIARELHDTVAQSALSIQMLLEASASALERDDPAAARVPERVARTVLRLAQSLLANAVQHADASRIVVSVEAAEEELILDVVDDGVGFSPGTAEGFGLRAARARALAQGGRLEVESTPGSGTAIHVELPLPAQDETEREETPVGR